MLHSPPMRRPLSIKNNHREARDCQNRIIAITAIILLVAAILVIRLFILQIIDHNYYKTQSLQNILTVVPIAPTRGLIYDRHALLLAKNIPSYRLDIVPEKTPDLAATLNILSHMVTITPANRTHFYHALHTHRPYEPIPLLFKLSDDEVARVAVNAYRLPGVQVDAALTRQYPVGEELSNVVGYVSRINAEDTKRLDPINYSATDVVGKDGIEETFEALLHGQVGHQEIETDANGHIVRVLKRTPPIPGKNITLTIDASLQYAAEHALGNKDGAIVAVSPSTGQILAMVTSPRYDPNLFTAGISVKDYKALLHSPDHPLINRAIRGEFAPASTAKPFYALEGLDTDTITPSDSVYDPGWFKLPNNKHIYHDYKRGGHGWVNVSKAIMVSCDTFFYNLAVKLGLSKLDTILHAFGFGEATQIDLPNAKTGLVPTPDWKRGSTGQSWFTGDTVNAGIGQGFVLVTPLQLAMATAALAEHGQRFKPQIILNTQAANQSPVAEKPTELPPIILQHPTVWHTVIHAMSNVITNPEGTGLYFGRHPGYSVAAKTGTAQVYGHTKDWGLYRPNLPKKLRNNELFIAFAPIKQPKIAIAVVVEHDGNPSTIARHVIDSFFHKETLHG